MNYQISFPTLAAVITAGALTVGQAADEGFRPLFNGRDLTGWVNANCAPETWSARDGVVHCTGKPTGALCTDRQYENFVLEVEWRHLSQGGNAGGEAQFMNLYARDLALAGF
jgi:hypothetical protein